MQRNNYLGIKKIHGLDKEVKSKDLSDETNAWVYLRNIGLGMEKN